MASNSFRESMNSLGWSRRDADVPVNTSSSSSSSSPFLARLQSLNPFGDGGYVRLPTQEGDSGPGAPLPAPSRREEEEGFFARESSLIHFRLFSVLCSSPFPLRVSLQGANGNGCKGTNSYIQTRRGNGKVAMVTKFLRGRFVTRIGIMQPSD